MNFTLHTANFNGLNISMQSFTIKAYTCWNGEFYILYSTIFGIGISAIRLSSK